MQRSIGLVTLSLLVACHATTPSAAPDHSAVDANVAHPEAEIVARARAIHSRLLTLDTHKDISDALATESSSEDPAEIERYRRRCDPTVRGDNQVDFPKMREGGYDCAFYVVYVGQGRVDGSGFVRAKRTALRKFDAIQRMCDKYPEHIGLARSSADVRRFHDEGRLIACIGIENGYPMGEDLELIEEFWRRGARYMGITHNRHNQLGDSHTPEQPLHGGLTELGRQAIAAMNRVGIMVDISHTSKSTMRQAIATSRAPVIASHSGCRAVHDHSRNLDDEQLLALKANGGVIQMVALGSFIADQTARRDALNSLREELDLPSSWDLWKMKNEQGGLSEEIQARVAIFDRRRPAIDERFPEADVGVFVDHIDHAVRTIGVDHVGIGTDFDGGGGISGFQNASESPNVTIELVRRGYTEEEIQKIWSGNLLRVWAEVERVAAASR